MKNINITNNKGFTLIELIITVAILGILAALATSLYESQSQKQRRSDGIIALTTAQSEMEQYRSDNGIYAGAGLVSTASPKTYYTVSVTAPAPGENYTLTAEADADDIQFADTNCRKFIVNDLAQYSAEKADGSNSPKCIPK